MITTIRRPVIKRCPFRDETDAGELTIMFAGDAPELHALAAEIDALCVKPASHEDFIRQVAPIAARRATVLKVTATWRTGPWSVEVTEGDDA